jgi:hypothetical protein
MQYTQFKFTPFRGKRKCAKLMGFVLGKLDFNPVSPSHMEKHRKTPQVAVISQEDAI